MPQLLLDAIFSPFSPRHFQEHKSPSNLLPLTRAIKRCRRVLVLPKVQKSSIDIDETKVKDNKVAFITCRTAYGRLGPRFKLYRYLLGKPVNKRSLYDWCSSSNSDFMPYETTESGSVAWACKSSRWMATQLDVQALRKLWSRPE